MQTRKCCAWQSRSEWKSSRSALQLRMALLGQVVLADQSRPVRIMGQVLAGMVARVAV